MNLIFFVFFYSQPMSRPFDYSVMDSRIQFVDYNKTVDYVDYFDYRICASLSLSR